MNIPFLAGDGNGKFSDFPPVYDSTEPLPAGPNADTDGNEEGEPAGNPPDPGARRDRDVARRLRELAPGWSADALDAFVRGFLRALALDPPGEVALDQYLGRLTDALKACGYGAVGRGQCRAILKAEAAALRASLNAAGSAGGSPGAARQRFVAVDDGPPASGGVPPPWGIWDREAGGGEGDFLTNFTVAFNEDVERLDGTETERTFKGRLKIAGRAVPFQIAAQDYAGDNTLRAAILAAAGPEAEFRAETPLIRRAISSLSAGQTVRRRTTTDVGWDEDGSAFLVPGGRVTAGGFRPYTDPAAPRPDLRGQELAGNLDLRPLSDPAELIRVRRHVVDDLLACHERPVTYALLGAVAAAPLYRFAGGIGRFALWLVGLTGTGKSYAAKLFQNFFGRFPVASGDFATWASTANYLPRVGYLFKDCLYLVDDYKPEVIPPYQVVRVLQNYADGTGRGRLKADATTHTTRPIRGLLLCTGEDIPEHSASAVARSVLIEVPQVAKDLARGRRCAKECANYSAVTADFLRWFLAGGRAGGFARRVGNLQQYYGRDVAGQQNAERIAGNFALLGAAFLEVARYLGDVWPGWRQEAGRFVAQDLVQVRDRMLAEVLEQQASEVFLRTLAELYRHHRIRVAPPGRCADGQDSHIPLVGKEVELRWAAPRPKRSLWQLSPALALEAVQESLRKQGKPQLKVTERTLIEQLRQGGKLLDAGGAPLPATNKGAGAAVQRVRVGGQRTNCITIEAVPYADPEPPRPRNGSLGPPRAAAVGGHEAAPLDLAV